MIKLENVSKIYKNGVIEYKAVNNISLVINDGEFISIMGPSGSGKSTLLYLLGTLETITEGKIYIDDLEISSLKDEKKAKLRRSKIGFIFQFYNLINELTVKDNILLPLIFDNKMKNYKDRYEGIINTVGLKGKENNFPSQLSGGEAQRVAIARALIIEPKIILADELTGNLDSKNKEEIMKLLKIVHDKYNSTIVMVTHDEAVAAYSDIIYELVDGEIIARQSVKL